MVKVIKQENRVPGKVLRLENKLNVIVNKNKHIVLRSAKEYGSGTMYTLCSYISLSKELGHTETIKKLLVENTDTYLEGCLSKIPNIRQLVEENNTAELEKRLFEIIDGYSTRYLKQCKEFDIIMVVASIDGYKFEEYLSS